MAELDGQGNPLDFYLFPPDGLWSTDPIFRKSGASYFYYQTDHLGTPQQLIDRAGNLIHSREMRAFGEVIESGMADRLRFPGQLHSQETGFYYNFFRDYSPKSGRFVQQDAIGHIGGLNFYIYSELTPLLKIDPKGLSWMRKFEECMNQGIGGNLAICEGLFWASTAELAVETYKHTCELAGEGITCLAVCTVKVLVGEDLQDIATKALGRHIKNRVRQTARAAAKAGLRRAVDLTVPIERVVNGGKIIHCTVSCVET